MIYPNRFQLSRLAKYILTILAVLLCLVACETSNVTNQVEQDQTPHMYLNDTGVISFTQDFTQRSADEPEPQALSAQEDMDAPGQDANFGNDRENNSNTDGSLGFQFVKLGENGKALAIQNDSYTNQPWACIQDKLTGLIWEVKTPDGFQQAYFSYSWYEPNTLLNGGHAGEANGEPLCGNYLPACNTFEYIKAVNQLNNGKGLCGLNKWRLPLREELRSILDYGVISGPMIDTNFFPNAAAEDTWTSQTAIYQQNDGSEAWEIHFQNGHSEAHKKSADRVVVRLVHDAR